MIDFVVFDIGGTVVKDEGYVSRALVAALADQGLVSTDEQLLRVRGSSKRDAIAQFIPDGAEHAARVQATYEGFRRHLTALHEIGGVHAVDGAAEIFHWLRGQGIHIALTTGFDRRVTGLLLAALNWGPETVDVVVCGDDVKRGRPDSESSARRMRLARIRQTTQGRVREFTDSGKCFRSRNEMRPWGDRNYFCCIAAARSRASRAS